MKTPEQPEECCEKCHRYAEEYHDCRTCPCHASPEQPEEKKCKACNKPLYGTIEQLRNKCDDCSPEQPEEKEPWEKEFKKIPYHETSRQMDYIRTLLSTQRSQILSAEIDENTSDGYHTFKELYEFRKLYNACLFNEWAKHGLYNVHKSQRHNDGEICFGRTDYFIVVAKLPTGQISNHYPMTDWDLYKCEAVEKATEAWDGHSSQDVAKRLTDFLTQDTLKDK